jgi:hypothetical protein
MIKKRVKGSHAEKESNKMVRRRYLTGFVVTGAVIISLLAIAVVPKLFENEKYCYSMLSPVNANSNESSMILESGCYNTFAESIQAATGGRVQLGTSFNPKDATDEILNH